LSPPVGDPDGKPLWIKVIGGYQVHDYLDWNPSKDKVEEAIAKKRAAASKGGHASWQSRSARQVEPKPKHGASTLVEPEPKHPAEPKVHQRKNRLANPDPIRSGSDPDLISSESLEPLSQPEAPASGPARSDSERILEELRRSPKTRPFATREWADELSLLAMGVRSGSVVAAIRKCVVGSQDGMSEQALKSRITGFVSKARRFEAVEDDERAEAEPDTSADEAAKERATRAAARIHADVA
jgi:hypothetical protein